MWECSVEHSFSKQLCEAECVWESFSIVCVNTGPRFNGWVPRCLNIRSLKIWSLWNHSKYTQLERLNENREWTSATISRRLHSHWFQAVLNWLTPPFCTMRTFVLLCLLALCHAKPYKPINIMDVLRDHDILMRDADDDDDDYDNDLFPSWDPPEPDCPFGCQCSRRVVQCSDLGKWEHLRQNSHSKLMPNK